MIQLDMPPIMDAAAEQRLSDYFDRIGQVLGNDARRASFAIYAMGILGDGERKSVEPIATRACIDPDRADAAHQRLLHFIAATRRDAAADRVERPVRGRMRPTWAGRVRRSRP